MRASGLNVQIEGDSVIIVNQGEKPLYSPQSQKIEHGTSLSLKKGDSFGFWVEKFYIR